MARVIRAHASVSKAVVLDAEARARGILHAAHEEREALRAHALSELEATRRAAHEQGVEEGRATVAALETRAAQARAKSIEDAEQALVGLVTKVAERVLHTTLTDAPERVVPAVRAELARLRRAKQVELRVHPDDAQALRAALASGETLEPEGTRIVADPSITRGGCVIASELGTLDARLEVQLEAFARALRGER